jgi:hypothetical protein
LKQNTAKPKIFKITVPSQNIKTLQNTQIYKFLSHDFGSQNFQNSKKVCDFVFFHPKHDRFSSQNGTKKMFG